MPSAHVMQLVSHAAHGDELVGGAAWDSWLWHQLGWPDVRWLPKENFALSNAWELWLLLQDRAAGMARRA